jgi:hypothetical protein
VQQEMSSHLKCSSVFRGSQRCGLVDRHLRNYQDQKVYFCLGGSSDSCQKLLSISPALPRFQGSFKMTALRKTDIK